MDDEELDAVKREADLAAHAFAGIDHLDFPTPAPGCDYPNCELLIDARMWLYCHTCGLNGTPSLVCANHAIAARIKVKIGYHPHCPACRSCGHMMTDEVKL